MPDPKLLNVDVPSKAGPPNPGDAAEPEADSFKFTVDRVSDLRKANRKAILAEVRAIEVSRTTSQPIVGYRPGYQAKQK